MDRNSRGGAAEELKQEARLGSSTREERKDGLPAQAQDDSLAAASALATGKQAPFLSNKPDGLSRGPN